MTMISMTVAMAMVVVTVTMGLTTMLEDKDAHEVNEESKDRNWQKSLVFHFGRLNKSLNSLRQYKKTDK